MKTKKNPVQRFERMKEVIEQRLDSVVLIVEATYMRHNLSAMFRTAESFGLQNVYFVCSKIYINQVPLEVLNVG